MFGILQCDSDNNNNNEYIVRSNGPSNGNSSGPQHSACDKCRAKKLRCSGQKSGCSRCQASGSVCTYTAHSRGGRRRRKPEDSRSKSPSAPPSPPSGPVAQSTIDQAGSSLALTVPRHSKPVSTELENGHQGLELHSMQSEDHSMDETDFPGPFGLDDEFSEFLNAMTKGALLDDMYGGNSNAEYSEPASLNAPPAQEHANDTARPTDQLSPLSLSPISSAFLALDRPDPAVLSAFGPPHKEPPPPELRHHNGHGHGQRPPENAHRQAQQQQQQQLKRQQEYHQPYLHHSRHSKEPTPTANAGTQANPRSAPDVQIRSASNNQAVLTEAQVQQQQELKRQQEHHRPYIHRSRQSKEPTPTANAATQAHPRRATGAQLSSASDDQAALASPTIFELPEPCTCLQRILVLLEELETKSLAHSPSDYSPLSESTSASDAELCTQKTRLGLMSAYKSGIRGVEAMLSCSECASRSEYLMLLAMTCTKLVGVAERIVGSYKASTVVSPPSSTSSAMLRAKRRRCESSGLERESFRPRLAVPFGPTSASAYPGSGMNPSQDHPTAQLGPFPVDTAAEWDSMTRLLLSILICELHGLVTRLQRVAVGRGGSSISSGGSREGPTAAAQVAVLRGVEHRLRAVVRSWSPRG